MPLYGNFIKIINESQDKSFLDKNFKKKNGLKFIIYDLKDIRIQEIISKHSLLQKYKNTNKKVGEIALESKSKQIAGYICVTNDDRKIISPLFVYNKYRGYGLSDILVKDAIFKYGGKKLGVFEDNEIAIRLYKKYGFEEDSYFLSNGEKVIIMKRE
jgi:ribosomal protein S18 acetylase RimI-like enzyme